jgi:hypothetical protein
MERLASHTARAVGSLGDAVQGLVAQRPDAATLRASNERGHFRPDEDIALKDWFARLLTVRGGLWEVLGSSVTRRPVSSRGSIGCWSRKSPLTP